MRYVVPTLGLFGPQTTAAPLGAQGPSPAPAAAAAGAPVAAAPAVAVGVPSLHWFFKTLVCETEWAESLFGLP